MIPPFIGALQVEENWRGSFVRFEDGRCLAWSRVLLDDVGSVVISGTWEYPIAFQRPPMILATRGPEKDTIWYDYDIVGPWLAGDHTSTQTSLQIGRVRGGGGFASEDWVELHVLALGETSPPDTPYVITVQERGVNSNGTYTLFNNGLLICQATVRAVFNDGNTLLAEWQFPRAYEVAPLVIGTKGAGRSVTAAPQNRITGPYHLPGSASATTASLLVGRNSDNPSFVLGDYWDVSCIAIGVAGG